MRRTLAIAAAMLAVHCDRGADPRDDEQPTRSQHTSRARSTTREPPPALATTRPSRLEGDEDTGSSRDDSIDALQDLAELVCSCTTPSCVHRMGTRVEAWKKRQEAVRGKPTPRQDERIQAALERIAECSDVAPADQ